MHSDLDQQVREDVMLDFKAGKINVVVATDIISRGIDIDNIETVINYDVPNEAEDYVHRIGRTARADREGSAYTFISEKERGKFRNIERLLEREVEKLLMCLRSWALHLPMINVMRIKVVEKRKGIGTGQRDVAGMVIKRDNKKGREVPSFKIIG